jgi:hypothetical protein
LPTSLTFTDASMKDKVKGGVFGFSEFEGFRA